MDHLFKIICQNCNSDDITINVYSDSDFEIECNNCGSYISLCGIYHTKNNDYTKDTVTKNAYS